MARARLLKPGFFRNETLAELPPLTRLLFAGLWTLADRKGRLEDRPRRIKADLFPWDDCDVDRMLADLESHEFITRYEADGVAVIAITTFSKHQNPHHREPESVLSEIPSDFAKPRKARGQPQASLGISGTSRAESESVPESESVAVAVTVQPAVARAATAVPMFVGKQKPLREYPRLRVFRFMVDELIAMLGVYAEAFDLDAYLMRLDASGEALPANIWPWLKERVAAEAARRGMGANVAPQLGKQTTRLAQALANIQAEEAAKRGTVQ